MRMCWSAFWIVPARADAPAAPRTRGEPRRTHRGARRAPRPRDGVSDGVAAAAGDRGKGVAAAATARNPSRRLRDAICQRKIHVAAAASPRLVFADYSSRARGVAATHQRPIQVEAAASRGPHPSRRRGSRAVVGPSRSEHAQIELARRVDAFQRDLAQEPHVRRDLRAKTSRARRRREGLCAPRVFARGPGAASRVDESPARARGRAGSSPSTRPRANRAGSQKAPRAARGSRRSRC